MGYLSPPYTINFIVNFSTLYKVIDCVWAVLMQKSFKKLLISKVLSQYQYILVSVGSYVLHLFSNTKNTNDDPIKTLRYDFITMFL